MYSRRINHFTSNQVATNGSAIGIFRNILGAVLLLLISGCRDWNVSPLRLGTNVWIGYEHFYVARERGYFKNTDIQLVEFRSSTQVMKAIQIGNINAAALTLDEALRVIDSGVDIDIVGVIDISSGGHAIVVRPTVKSLSDLQGQRVGFENSAVGAYILSRALQNGGLRGDSILAISSPPESQEQMFRSKQIDAVVAFDPYLSRLIASGAEVISDGSETQIEVVDVLVVRKDVEAAQRERLIKLLQGFYRAKHDFEENPKKISAIMADRLDISDLQIAEAYRRINTPTEKKSLSMLKKNGDVAINITFLSAILSDIGMVRGACDCGNNINPSVMQSVLDAGDNP